LRRRGGRLKHEQCGDQMRNHVRLLNRCSAKVIS
jgi:hypothetical protein